MISVIAEGSRKKLRAEIEDAVLFYVLKLMPRVQNLHIDVSLIRNLSKKEGIFGDCSWNDQNHRPRDFTIRLDSALEERDIHETLAHEMVHVKQFVRGELVDLARESTSVKWMGKRMNWSNDDNEPWEIEPNERSLALYEEWLSYK